MHTCDASRKPAAYHPNRTYPLLHHHTLLRNSSPVPPQSPARQFDTLYLPHQKISLHLRPSLKLYWPRKSQQTKKMKKRTRHALSDPARKVSLNVCCPSMAGPKDLDLVLLVLVSRTLYK
jgi:hypothetical protein